jgi:hypothetical protein
MDGACIIIMTLKNNEGRFISYQHPWSFGYQMLLYKRKGEKENKE